MSGLVELSTDARSKTIGQNFRCRAWVNFNGTGTVAKRDSGNVSSVTDNGTGDYTVNFTIAMPNANYAVVCGNSYNRFIHTNDQSGSYTRSITACKVGANDSGGLQDQAFMEFAIFS